MVTRANLIRMVFLLFGIGWMGCTDYQNETIKIPKPKVSEPTATLEANYTTSPPNSISSTYWNTANYLPVTAQNIVTGQVPPDDGLYNVSGTYNGLTNFNQGKNPKITLKAAYDDNNIYVLVSWRDTTYNMSNANWVFNGPTDPNKSGSTSGWTSQRSDDRVILSFDMGSSKRDVWNWSLALSEPVGYAIDMIDNSGVVNADTGSPSFTRNIAGTDDRSGPQFQWDDVQQQLNRSPGGLTILDPGYFILTKTNFVGNALNGDAIFQNTCAPCHGVNADGNGVNEQAAALNAPGFMNRFTKSAFVTFASSSSHDGSVDFLTLTSNQIDDLFARLRGYSGVPGYYLQTPTGSSSDIHSLSNVQLAKIDGYNTKGYKVLLVRALNTGNADDVVFNPSTGQYQFNISLSDNDDLNQIGELNNTLTFKPKP